MDSCDILTFRTSRHYFSFHFTSLHAGQWNVAFWIISHFDFQMNAFASICSVRVPHIFRLSVSVWVAAFFFHFIFCILRIVSADYLLVQKETLIISLFFFVFVVRNKNTRIHLIHTHIIFITIYMCFNLLPMKEEPIMRSRNGPKSEGEKE